jgi:hypothetical protein
MAMDSEAAAQAARVAADSAADEGEVWVDRTVKHTKRPL